HSPPCRRTPRSFLPLRSKGSCTRRNRRGACVVLDSLVLSAEQTSCQLPGNSTLPHLADLATARGPRCVAASDQPKRCPDNPFHSPPRLGAELSGFFEC